MNRRCPQCGTSFPDEAFFCGNDGTITIQEQDPADPDPRLGSTLGGYVIVARVADGAWGRVYEGRHPETRAQVAVKVLHPSVVTDAVAVERFKREYETANEFDHRHIVQVMGFGPTPDGSFYMTMEYLYGEELGQILKRYGALPMERVVRIVAQAALALDYAHSFGVIHRDLKPENVFLCESAEGDDVRLLDFGSVKLQMETGPKLTAFGTTLGSPYYMSPEQAMGKQDVDQRTDVFALAAILFEMMTGRVCFEGSNVAEILMKIVNEATPLPSQVVPHIPASLDNVVERGLRKEKAERYESALQLAGSFCSALGLVGSVDAWAAVAETEVAGHLARQQPQEGAPPAHAAVAPATAPHVPSMPTGYDPLAGSRSRVLLVAGAALVGLLVLGGAVAFLLL